MSARSICVVGGGTAGWFTALFAKQIFPNDDITVIESKEIGIIGVGEGTTPNVVTFLRDLGIDIADLIKHCDVTIKNGISFENWNGDGEKYFHPFNESLVNFSIPPLFTFDCFDYYLKTLATSNLPFNEYVYQPSISYDNKVDLKNTLWSIHFNANKLADYLKTVGQKRQINLVEGNYKIAIQDKNGFIKKIVLDGDREIKCDFVFDCTGFHRLLIGKLFNQKWISYSDYLPMKKAIPFWLDSNEEYITPHTKSTAMKYGWTWEIPLQSRIGAGYVFDSDYIDENQALEEAEIFYGRKLEIRKIINFEAGRYENVWVKNCMAVGLSSGFIEPLEATSLFSTVGQLNVIKQFLNDIDSPSECNLKLFNDIISTTADDIMNFVHLHYISTRNDSAFWKEFKYKNKMPKKLEGIFEKIKTGNLKYFDIMDYKSPVNFPLTSYLHIATGLKISKNHNKNIDYVNITPSPLEYKRIIGDTAAQIMYHKDFLKNIKDN